MISIDYAELKLKLVASIVAISSIKLLEGYMNIEHETDRDLAWQAACLELSSSPRCCSASPRRSGALYSNHKTEKPD